MQISDLSLNSDKLSATLLPLLLDRVFHVTRQQAAERILAEGEVRANVTGELAKGFGYSNSFFRKRGCVSVFDYRSASSEQIGDAIGKCSPYNLPPTNPELLYEPKIAFLFLTGTACEQLVPWTRWKEEEAWGDQIVPWVEAGYPGSIPITLIEAVLLVTIDYPLDDIASILHRARFRRSRT